MTRKRFIRLMMAKGIQRNPANDFADQLIQGCGTWETAYVVSMLIYLPRLTKRFDALARFAVQQGIKDRLDFLEAIRNAWRRSKA